MSDLNLVSNIHLQNEIISQQPSIRLDREEESNLRQILPISTIDWQSNNSLHLLPLTGLEFLRDIDELVIQETLELSNLISEFHSSNRYTIRVPRGETIYYAKESSSPNQIKCFGSNRAFDMELFDHTHQNCMIFKRKLSCGKCCPCCCCLQQLEIYQPNGELLGTIQQRMHITKTKLAVLDKFNNLVYNIEGPAGIMCFSPNFNNFNIYSTDGLSQVGAIVHKWDSLHVSYNIFVQLPNKRLDIKLKAIILGAAFLLDYMFFRNLRTNACNLCCF